MLGFWTILLLGVWLIPLLTTPAQNAPKTAGSQERIVDEKKKQTKGKEGFVPGRFPVAVDTTLLHGDYEEPKTQSLGPYGVATTTKNYPVFAASSCGTNNLRYWRRPSNGTASWPELEGAFYKATPQDIPGPPAPPAWAPGTRVNFFEYCLGK